MIGVETCDRCGFDRSQWNEQDAGRTLAHADELLAGWSIDARPELESRLLEHQMDDLKAVQSSPDLYDEVHHLWHGLVSIADIRRKADDAVARQVGSVAQISSSAGGVPKTAIDSAVVGVRGVDGDVQASRVHHGRPWQALCLWSTDVVDEFAAAGHPIAYGSCGENLTLSGLDWSTMRGGTIIDIGGGADAVRIQLSAPSDPCSKNSAFFTNSDINLMDHDRNPGHSRWYASVLRPGTITSGDAVTVSPI
ncbi:MAG: MOSC domain-containing protein [Ilumatobacter sp.]|uniref:MOSC domain-containing protein n=1 Tax=Ilumatobacter sp. TaxID=1967498 RepID=UPI003C73BC0F